MGVKSRIRNIDKELKGWMNVMANAIKGSFDEIEKRIDELEKQIKKSKEIKEVVI